MAAIQEETRVVAGYWTLPSVLYRPRVFKDGNAWCCLYGVNIQEGVCAFGATPQQAVHNFDYYAWQGTPEPDALKGGDGEL